MTTVDQASYLHRSRVRGERVPVNRTRSFSVSLSAIGLLTIAISAWGGIVPYVGPAFGFSADGAGSWSWSMTHSVLALIPGALGVLIGFSFLARVPDDGIGRRKASLGFAGLLAVACGAWFVLGPLAWRVIDNVGPYFVTTSPLRQLANQAGYALGPGLILAMCGAFAIGWATRHNRPLAASSEAAAAPAAPAPVVAPTAGTTSATAGPEFV
jgi:hypothetical protein